MKKHNVIKVVLVTILIFLLLSWILPAAYYSGEYVDQGRVQMGLFDLFNYPLTAIAYFGYITFFLVLVGGFYGILYKIPAYRSFLEGIVEKVKGKEIACLSVLVVIISLLVSVCGLHIGFALFIPFVVSLVLLMGYDKITALFVTVGAISAGLMGTTYAYNNLSVLTQTFSLKIDYNLGVRFIILLVGVVLVIFNMIMYNKSNKLEAVKEGPKFNKKKEEEEEEEEEIEEEKKEVFEKKETVKVSSKNTKNNSSKNNKNSSNTKNKNNSSKRPNNKSSKTRKSVNKAALKDEEIIVVKDGVKKDYLIPEKVNKNTKVLPLAIIFSLLFILFVLAFIPWGDNGFKVKFFTDLTTKTSEFKLFGFPLFAKVLGTFNAFGSWSITDLFVPMFLTILLLVIIYKVKFDDVVDGFIAGAKKAFAPAMISVFLYTVLVINTYHPFQMTIYKFVLGLAKDFNVATTVIVSLLSGLFNSDMAYSFQSVAPYYVSVVTKLKDYSVVGVIFQSMYGFSMLFVPTSLVLMGSLSYVGVSYREWLKKSWKLLLELFVILLIAFIILALL